MNESMTIGVAIKQQREKNGYSMRQLAERSDLSTSSISMIESGNRDPSLRTLVSIAEALDLSVVDLISKASVLMKNFQDINKDREELQRKKQEIIKLSKSISASLNSMIS